MGFEKGEGCRDL